MYTCIAVEAQHNIRANCAFEKSAVMLNTTYLLTYVLTY